MEESNKKGINIALLEALLAVTHMGEFVEYNKRYKTATHMIEIKIWQHSEK